MKKLLVILSALLLWFTPVHASSVHGSTCEAPVIASVHENDYTLLTLNINLKNNSAYRVYLADSNNWPARDLASGDHSGKVTVKLYDSEIGVRSLHLDCK